ncbi:hypothetical protein SPRG_06750 [Saprolegnia parasitica CBS 223.65]|uniref:Uncharacterized protein n=1 Tax=Saprolegnia parasitica (strain CBS 223.65) TaxID=695850 RepID=A0A067CPN8_SAPPC|nr:hypothetical protein SPRG_06750 [Saprolegnia parasitica CBS 223.65]KDO28511.1 hypothetical protein SPRG_06750 [Saprolegnia parasitica CBS 223.65]|eukprot:XP_012200947.1 hypothetical protein SPRG_06750 [Saprolegnia parasitica CBS 223.65]
MVRIVCNKFRASSLFAAAPKLIKGLPVHAIKIAEPTVSVTKVAKSVAFKRTIAHATSATRAVPNVEKAFTRAAF